MEGRARRARQENALMMLVFLITIQETCCLAVSAGQKLAGLMELGLLALIHALHPPAIAAMTEKSLARNATEAQEMEIALQNAAMNANGTGIALRRKNARQTPGRAPAMAAALAEQSKGGATIMANGQANTSA